MAPVARTLLLHYMDRQADGMESLFRAFVSRGFGRVRIVAVLHRNAIRFETAVENPKSYALQYAGFGGGCAAEFCTRVDWLVRGVCYAEMVGCRPNVPRDPTTDKATIFVEPTTVSAISAFLVLRQIGL